MRHAWPWLLFGILALGGLTVLWRATTPPADIPTLIIDAADPTADSTTDTVPLLLTALANQPGSAGNPAIVATTAPTPTNTPLPKRPTVTPWPSCPRPGGVCEWPDVAPTRIAPTPTVLPVCVTPIVGGRCRDVAPTPTPGQETSGAVDVAGAPPTCAALYEGWC